MSENRPNKTLLLSEIFPPKVGGSARWFWEIYSRLPRDEHIVAAGQDPADRDFDAKQDMQINRLPLTLPSGLLKPANALKYLRTARQVRDLIRSHSVNVVHCGRCLPEGLLALMARLRTGVPYACFAHGEEVNLSNSELSPPWYERTVYSSKELGLLAGLVLQQASYVIANSRNTRRILIDRWRLKDERVDVLHPGVDTTVFRPVDRSPALRQQLGWDDRPVVLTVGRLTKRKGQDTLIRALAKIRDSVPNVLYAVVGDGEELAHLRKLSQEMEVQGNVIFMTDVDDDELLACYQQCDLFALPNRQIRGDIEGFGMVLVEAQACGKPVLAGASGGTAETMQVPDTGQLIHCEVTDHLANAVINLLLDEPRRQQMGLAARQWVVSQFDWASLTSKAKSLFSSRAVDSRTESVRV